MNDSIQSVTERSSSGLRPPTRPALRWHGGKWKLAPWIISHFPPHRVYVEPFGGAASVLLRKPRSYYECYNDLDDEVVNLFKVLRSPRAGELIDAVALTPFSRTEFNAAYALSDDCVERARTLIVRLFMGHGSGGVFRRPTGFRANANASGEHNTAAEWAGYPSCLADIADRMTGVVIENRDATELMRASDRTDTLHYVDPPYLPDTRSPRARRGGQMYHAYAHELSEADHRALLGAMRELRGMVVLSGYPAPLYDAELQGWTRVEKQTLADGARPRTEVLWINPVATAALDRGNANFHTLMAVPA